MQWNGLKVLIDSTKFWLNHKKCYVSTKKYYHWRNMRKSSSRHPWKSRLIEEMFGKDISRSQRKLSSLVYKEPYCWVQSGVVRPFKRKQQQTNSTVKNVTSHQHFNWFSEKTTKLLLIHSKILLFWLKILLELTLF